MAKKKTYSAYEYCKIYEGDYSQSSSEIVFLPKTTFNLLCDYIKQEDLPVDAEQVMSICYGRGGTFARKKNYIKLSKYVGTIQTSDGVTIEVLPKIYKASNGTIQDAKSCREVFLEMLKHFSDANAKSFQNAPISSSKDFPLLEVYISNYLDKLDDLLTMGLHKGYTQIEENSNFLKGKLLVSQNIRKNAVDQSKFFIRHSKYLEDIPQNRILMSTLHKLLDLTGNAANESRIYSLQERMDGIPESSNIESDLNYCSAGNRLFSSYGPILEWSEKILHGEGFTSFSGSTVNLALFFSAEKLFESYVAYLFKKYAKDDWTIYPQHRAYYLVDNQDGRKLFNLRPDIVAENKADNNIVRIFDTKWKIVDTKNIDGNYGISQDDMYQLYAYGQKYKIKRGGETPKLTLLYPATDKFNKENGIGKFVYDAGGLEIEAVPFDLSDKSTFMQQIETLLL